jgi:hypothetical protein
MVSLSRGGGTQRTQGEELLKKFHKYFEKKFIKNAVYNKK